MSLKDEAQANIPEPTMPVAQAIELFAKKGLNKDDFVVLLGINEVCAHKQIKALNSNTVLIFSC